MRRGAGWEALLNHWHGQYQKHHRARVAKNHPEAKYIRGRIEYVAEGEPDFGGTLAGGTSVLFDAKDCDEPRWALSQLKKHQAKALEGVHILGGVAFVALRLNRKAYVLPWGRLRDLYWRWVDGKAPHGDASLGPAEVAELGIPMRADGWIDLVPEIKP